MQGVGTYGGTNTAACWSGTIWGDCPEEALRERNSADRAGFLYEKHFTAIPGGSIPTTEGAFGDLALFSSTGGTAVGDTTEVGGGLKIGSDGDNEGVGIRTVIVPSLIALTAGDFWFEARMLTSTITDAKHNIFLGLFENVSLTATVPITAAGALSDNNMIGFQRPESARTTAGTGGAIMNAVYKADGQTAVNAQTDAVTLVAATYTNLGMKFVPKRQYGGNGVGAGYFTWYQDGVQVAKYLVTSTAGNPFPNDVNLGFCFAVLNATATTPGTSTIKSIRMAQLITALP